MDIDNLDSPSYSQSVNGDIVVSQITLQSVLCNNNSWNSSWAYKREHFHTADAVFNSFRSSSWDIFYPVHQFFLCVGSYLPFYQKLRVYLSVLKFRIWVPIAYKFDFLCCAQKWQLTLSHCGDIQTFFMV